MSSSPPPLTVVTPSFNQTRYIERTIQSVLSQDVPSLEYLIFDACSTDGTQDVLARYRDRATVIIEADAGQADAVNKGLRRASGDVIGWLNSDDVYYPGACARVLQEFETDPSLDMLYGEADHVDERDRVIEPYPIEPFDYARLQQVCFFCQPAVFFRRRVVERFGLLRADLQYCMDYEYWLRVCSGVTPRLIAVKLAGSRLHAETKTLGSRVAVHREILEMMAQKFGQPPARWVHNLAHAVAEAEGFTRETPAANRAFVAAVVRESTRLFEQRGGVPVKERVRMAAWAWRAWRAS